MSFETLFKLKCNPFRMTPATSNDELIWAGFPVIKQKIEDRIKRNIEIPNSSLVLNWGEYGSGKTHAAKYFIKKSVMENISSTLASTLPYSILFVLPKGKSPVFDIFVSIIDKMDIDNIREKFIDIKAELFDFIENNFDNLHLQNVIKAFLGDAKSDLVKKYLYGSMSNSELKELNSYGILRLLNTDSDYTKFLAYLFSCFTFEKKVFSSVILWIDEFEDLAILSNVNVDKTNNFIRELLDNTPNNLLIFLNLTQTALVSMEDLGQYLSEAVRSRIRDRIHFDFPTKEELILYMEELLNHTNIRIGDPDYKTFPFEINLIEKVIEELKNASLRRYNEAFSMLLEIAGMENVSPLTVDFFTRNKNDIVGWKE